MKRIVIITVIVAMFGWAIYDYVSKSNQTAEPAVESYTQGTENENNADDQNEQNAQTDSSSNEEGNREETEDKGEIQVGLQKGMLAPDFELETTDGEVVRLSDFRGERVMLNFWATWCPPCRAEMPDMQRFYEDKDVVILAVNLTETRNEATDVYPFLEEFGVTFPVLLDKESQVSFQYQIQPIPTNFLINSNGVIHNVAYGALNYELMVSEFEKMD